jgi:cytochrome P450
MQVAFDLNHLDPGFFDDPYPVYRDLRERAPMHRMADGSWFLTSYADLHALYRDTQAWSSDKRAAFKPKYGESALFEHHTTSLVLAVS